MHYLLIAWADFKNFDRFDILAEFPVKIYTYVDGIMVQSPEIRNVQKIEHAS